MKKEKAILMLIISMVVYNKINAQVINWKNVKEKHIVNLNLGGDYGIVGGLSYAQKIESKYFPMWVNIDFSTPVGKDLLDDYKVKAGGQIRILSFRQFQIGTSLQVLFRTINMHLVKVRNLGGELVLTGGYYNPRWFIAGEVGFDKASLTHIEHKDSYELIYPEAKNGWYEVPTGGNFNFGIRTGVSFSKNDLYLKSGMLRTQDFKSMPLLPFYAQLGYNYRF